MNRSLVKTALVAVAAPVSAIVASPAFAQNSTSAAETGVTLAAFSRVDRATIYTHPERIRD